jgi:hypothetical protein
MPPEVVKELFLNESLGNILSTNTLPSRSPPVRQLSSDAPFTTVAPGPGFQSNTQAAPVAAALQYMPNDCMKDGPSTRSLPR